MAKNLIRSAFPTVVCSYADENTMYSSDKTLISKLYFALKTIKWKKDIKCQKLVKAVIQLNANYFTMQIK